MAVLTPLRRLAALAIPAAGLVAACAPPDAPAQSDWADQQIEVDAGGRADTGVVEAEWLETLDGTWLQYTQASNCVDVFGVSYVDQMQRTFYIVQTEQNQLGVLTETFTACDVELAPVLGLQATVPQALLQSTWPVTVTGGLTTGSLRPGAGYTSGPLAELWGLALDDPFNDPVPTIDDGPDDPRIVDLDEDGNPGSTLVFPDQCDAYIAQRTNTLMSGIMTAPDRIEGGIPLGHGVLNAHAGQYIVSASNPLCATRYGLSPNPGRGQFVRVRVDGRGGALNIDADGDGVITCDEALPWKEPEAGLFERIDACSNLCNPANNPVGVGYTEACVPD